VILLVELDLKLKNKMSSVVVVGGGIGGLYAAWELCKKGFSVTVIEQQKFVGGLSTSIPFSDCLIDIGPHFISLKRDSNITKIIYDLIGEKDIIEISSIQNSIKSLFQGQILDESPRLFHAIKTSIVHSMSSFLFSKIFLSKNKSSDDIEKYLIALYGNYLFNVWCKPMINQNIGLSNIDLVKKSFEPITFKKILSYVLKSNSKKTFEPLQKSKSEMLDCYFRYGMKSIIDSFQSQIIQMGGKIMLETEIQKIDHNKNKIITYKQNNNIETINSNIILYSIPLIASIQWFEYPKNLKPLIKKTALNSIMVVLLIDTKKLFDGWILDIYDSSVSFFRIAQQSFLSNKIAPQNKTLLNVEIKIDEKNILGAKKDTEIYQKVIEDLKKLKILKNEKIIDYKIIKIKNLYPKKNMEEQNLSEISKYINSHLNEFTLGVSEPDSGRLISENNDKTSLGGFYNSLLNSQKIINFILSSEKSEKHKN
jgi:protoporphyrinogen oxidase